MAEERSLGDQSTRPAAGVNRAISLSLPVDLEARLRRIADERVVSPSYLATRALEKFLDELPPLP